MVATHETGPCRYTPLLEAYLDGTMQEAAIGEIDAHLNAGQCGECARRMDELAHDDSFFDDAASRDPSLDVEDASPSPRFLDQLGRALSAMEPPGSVRMPNRASVRTNYRFIREIGHGGLGFVFLYRDEELGRDVAVKVLRLAKEPDAARRRRRLEVRRRWFLRESKITSSLENSGVPPVYGAGTLKDEYGTDRDFYAMRFFPGITLRDRIDRFYRDRARQRGARLERAHPAFRELMQRFRSVCNTMRAAHQPRPDEQRLAVIHRDLKPENVQVNDVETVVLDWGLAQWKGDTFDSDWGEEGADPPEGVKPHDTSPGRIVGTIGYLSPEQARGDTHSLDERTDIYGLGAILFYLLTGSAPHVGLGSRSSRRLVLERIRKGPTPRAADRARHTIPPELDSICATAMAFDPADRYQTVGDLLDDLDQWSGDARVKKHRYSWFGRFSLWARGHRALVRAGIVSLAVVALVAVGSALLIDQSRRQQIVAQQTAEANERETRRQKARVERVSALHFLEKSRESLGRRDTQGALAFQLASLQYDDPQRDLKTTARRLEDILDQAPRLRLVWGHDVPTMVTRIAATEEGQHLVAFGNNGTIHYVDYRTGATIRQLPSQGFVPMSFSEVLCNESYVLVRSGNAVDVTGPERLPMPDGRQLDQRLVDGRPLRLVAQGQAVRVEDAKSGAVRGETIVVDFEAGIGRLSSDGRWAVVHGDDHSVSLLDVSSGRRIPILTEPAKEGSPLSQVSSIRFLPGTRTVCITTSQGLHGVDVPTGKTLFTLAENLNSTERPVMGPMGWRFAAAMADGTVRVFDARRGEPLGTPVFFQERVSGFAFTPDGQRLLVFGPRSVQLWDTLQGVPVGREVRPADAVRQAIALDDRHAAVLLQNGMVHVWDLLPPAGAPAVRTLVEGAEYVTAHALSHDQRTMAVASSHSVALRDSQSGVLETLPFPFADASLVRFSLDDRRLLTSSYQRFAVWDIATGVKLLEQPWEGSSRAVCFDASSQRLAAGMGNRVSIWSLQANEEPRQIQLESNLLYDVRFGPRGEMLWTVTSAAWTIWDLDRNEPQWRQSFGGRVSNAAISPTLPSVVTIEFPDIVTVWTRAKGLAHRFDAHNGVTADSSRFPMFSPDGRHFLTSTSPSREVRLWDSKTGRAVGSPLPHDESLPAFSSDGGRLLTQTRARPTDERLRLQVWSKEALPVNDFEADGWPVSPLAFVDEGGSLTFSAGDAIRRWEWGRNRLPLADVLAEASLVSGRSVSQNRVGRAAAGRLWRRVRSGRPERFGWPQDGLRQWHRRRFEELDLAVGESLDRRITDRLLRLTNQLTQGLLDPRELSEAGRPWFERVAIAGACWHARQMENDERTSIQSAVHLQRLAQIREDESRWHEAADAWTEAIAFRQRAYDFTFAPAPWITPFSSVPAELPIRRARARIHVEDGEGAFRDLVEAMRIDRMGSISEDAVPMRALPQLEQDLAARLADDDEARSLRHVRGLVHLYAGRLEQAATDLADVTADDAQDPRGWYVRAVVADARGDLPQSAEALETALSLAAESWQTAMELGHARARAGDWPAAFDAYWQSWRGHPQWIWQWEGAGNLARVEFEARPDNAFAHAVEGLRLGLRAAAAPAEGQSDAMQKHIQQAIDLDDENWRFVYLRALSQAGRAPDEQVLADLERAIALGATDWEVWYQRGLALGRQEQFAAALASFDEAVQRGGDEWQVWTWIGSAAEGLAQWERANQAYTRAVDAGADDWSVWHRRAFVRAELAQYDAAAADCRTAISMGGDVPVLQNEYAYALAALDRSAEAVDALLHAIESGDSSDLSGHLRRFNEVVEGDPADHWARFGRGVARFHSGDAGEAVADFEQALRGGLRDERLQTYLGRALYEAERWHEAERVLAEAARQTPNAETNWLWLARTELRLDREREAFMHISRVIELDEDDREARRERARIACLLGMAAQATADVRWLVDKALADQAAQQAIHQEAVAWYTEGLAKHAGHVPLRQARGEARFAIEDWSAAIEDFDAVIEVGGEQWRVCYFRGRARLAIGAVASALSDLQTAYRLADAGDAVDAEILFHAGTAEEALEAWSDAERAYSQALEREGADAWQFYFRRAYVRFKLEKLAEAQADATAAIEKVTARAFPAVRGRGDPGVAQVSALRGWIHFERGMFAEAVEDFERSIDHQVDAGATHYGLGQALVELERHDEAIQAFTEAIERGAEGWGPWLDRGTAQIVVGNSDAALADFEEARVRDAPEGSVQLHRGRALLTLERFQEAESVLTESLAEDSSSSLRRLYYRGMARSLQDKHAEAEADFDECLALDPEFTQALEWRARVRRERGRYAESLEDVEKALALGYDAGSLYAERARTLAVLGENKLALAAWNEAVRRAPDDVSYRLGRGELHETVEQYAAAAADYSRAIALSPDQPELHLLRGLVLHQLDRWEEAEADWNVLLAADPHSTVYLRRRALGRLMQTDFSGAVKDFTTALEHVEDADERIGFQIERGLAYDLMGREVEALAEFDTAIAQGSPELRRRARRHRVSVLGALGRWRELVADCSILLAEDQQNHEIRVQRAEALLQLEQWAEALKDLDVLVKAGQDAGRSGDHRASRAVARARLQQYEPAVRDLVEVDLAKLTTADRERLVKAFASGSETEAESAWIHAGLGLLHVPHNSATAIAHFDKAISGGVDLWQVRLQHGTALFEEERWDESDRQLKAVMAQRPEDWYPRHLTAMIARSTGSYEDAIAKFDEAERLAADRSVIPYQRAMTHLWYHHWDKAIEDFDRVFELQPDHAESLTMRGHMYAELEQYDKAAESYREADALFARLDPDHPHRIQPQAFLAFVSLAMEDETAYRGAYRKLLEQYADSDEARSDLLEVCLASPDAADVPRLVELARELVGLDPDRSESHLLLARALLAEGSAAEAMDVMKRARSLHEEGGTAWHALVQAEAAAALDDSEAAHGHLDEGLRRIRDRSEPSREHAPLRWLDRLVLQQMARQVVERLVQPR